MKAGEEGVSLPLAAHYVEEHVAVRVKLKTAAKARIAVRRHILPPLGRLPLASVERNQIVDVPQKMSGSPSAANTVVKILSHMYGLAAGWGVVPEGSSPCPSTAPPGLGLLARSSHPASGAATR